METKICKECNKDKESNRKCAFLTGKFSNDNYRCGTMVKLREYASEGDPDYALSINAPLIGIRWRIGDSSFGALEMPDDVFASFIVMTWYKDRGQTGQAWIMRDDEEPRLLTLEEAEKTLEFWEKAGFSKQG